MYPKLCLFLVFCIGYALAQSDKVIYDLTSQARCTEVERGPTRDCRWAAGLDMADLKIEGGRIAAYKIKWFSGKWSSWFVPGINDIDGTFNPTARTCDMSYKANSLRRWWSVFYDHDHIFIICKPH